MFAFELLILFLVLFSEVDGELEVLAVDAAVRADVAGADAEQTFPERGLVHSKDNLVIN
ncbi:MAG: hypothetical protein H0V76_00750 [Blastocatellia bacterium]|nr:hypothetical protein [Blastocatellia bacterium]